MTKKLSKALLTQTAASALSLSVLYAVLILHNAEAAFGLELVLAVLAIRIFQNNPGAHPKSIFQVNLRSSVAGTIADEMRLAVGLLAACYLFQWSVAMSLLFQFFGANLITQTALTYMVEKSNYNSSSRPNGVEPDPNSRKAIVLGTGEIAKGAVNAVLDNIASDISIIGFLDYKRQDMWRYRDIPLIGHPEQLEKIISTEQVDLVIFAVVPEELSEARQAVHLAEKMGVTIVIAPQLLDLSLAGFSSVNLGNIPAIEYSTTPSGRLSLFFKSLIDRIGALVGLILSAPIMFAAAVAIKIDSPGPVFFRQTRSGINGKKFRLWKFRTMVTDAEKKKAELLTKNEMSGPVFKISNDPRVTGVGHFLRKYSIDEFPQFLNVLLGDMSLVGPRPALPAEVAAYEPWQHRKLSVKPGLTCLWQTDGRNDIDFEDWMKLDLEYIDNWSLWADTKIIAKTIPTVLKGSGK